MTEKKTFFYSVHRKSKHKYIVQKQNNDKPLDYKTRLILIKKVK